MALFNAVSDLSDGYAKLIRALEISGYLTSDHPRSLAAIPLFSPECPRTAPRIGLMIEKFYLNSFSVLSLFPQIPSTTVSIDEIWVNLDLQQRHGQRPTDDYHQCLRDAMGTDRPLVVKGEPGVGKSTLIKKLCKDWGMKKLPQYNLVLACRFREVSSHPQKNSRSLIDVCVKWMAERIPGVVPTDCASYLVCSPEIAKPKSPRWVKQVGCLIRHCHPPLYSVISNIVYYSLLMMICYG